MGELSANLLQLAPLITAVVAMTSATVALLVYRYTRIVNRRRATLDMIMKTFLDAAAQETYQKFKEITRKELDPNDCFKIESLIVDTPENQEDRDKVRNQLNSYELISLGIRQGLFDENFYKHWFHGQFTKDFKAVEPYIDAIQSTKPSVYCEFTQLNDRWARNRHPIASPSRARQAWWLITGQDKRLNAARANDASP